MVILGNVPSRIKVGGVYEIVNAPMDPEDERLINIARRRQEVNHMFDKKVTISRFLLRFQNAAINKRGKRVSIQSQPSEDGAVEEKRGEVFGAEGGSEQANPIRTTALPYMKTSDF